jgi:hypothetical protein
MRRIAGYVVGLAAFTFIVLSIGFHFDFAKGATHMIALLIALVAFPIGCVLDFLGRGKRILPRVPFWLLRATALGGWVFIAFVWYVMMSFYFDLRPEPLTRQGPDTENARSALIRRFGAGPDEAFRNAYYFLDPTFTGRSYEFLRFDYADKTDLLRRLGGSQALMPTSPRDCECQFAPGWWPRSTTGITSAFRFGVIERVCLEEADHRAYILVIGH